MNTLRPWNGDLHFEKSAATVGDVLLVSGVSVVIALVLTVVVLWVG